MLEKSILKTLEYFDIQDHVLTVLELHKYLVRLSEQEGVIKFSLSEVLECLERMVPEKVGIKNGFYFLKGREDLVDRRIKNNYYSTTRIRRVQKYLPGVRFVPFIAGVALTGSEALANSKQGSDIDILVLTKKNRMWLARLFLTVYFQIFGVRRYKTLVENRFCLNHYIQERKLLSDDRNMYTAVEYASLIPYFGGEEVYNFQKVNETWISTFLLQPQIVFTRTPKSSKFKLYFEKLLSGYLGDWLEGLVGKMQKERIKIQEYILVESDELSFHPASKGQQVLKKYSKRAV